MSRLQDISARIRLAGLILTILFAALPHQAHADKVKQLVMEVDLKNPTTLSEALGDNVATISFFIQSSKLTKAIINGIDVRSPAGQRNLFPAGSVTFDEAPTLSAFKVILTPTKVFGPNQNIQFVMTIPGLDTINILEGAENQGTRIVGGPPQWFNNDSPPKQLFPAPPLPGFSAKPKDTDYTVFNDTADPFAINNLQFLPNITMSTFDALNLDAIIAQTPTMNLDLTPSSIFADFPNLPDPDPGNLFIAEGQLLDPSGNTIGAFAEGVQVELVPEPSALILLGTALVVLLPIARRGSLRST